MTQCDSLKSVKKKPALFSKIATVGIFEVAINPMSMHVQVNNVFLLVTKTSLNLCDPFDGVYN